MHSSINDEGFYSLWENFNSLVIENTSTFYDFLDVTSIFSILSNYFLFYSMA